MTAHLAQQAQEFRSFLIRYYVTFEDLSQCISPEGIISES